MWFYKRIKPARRLVLTLLLVLARSVPTFAAGGGPSLPVLSYADDASTAITVSWRDSEQKTEVLQIVSQTQYDKTGFDGTAGFAAACKDISLDGSGAWRYEAIATGLAPATAYAYRVGCEGNWSETKSFITDDPASQSLTFAYLGDIQTNINAEREYALWGELAENMYRQNPALSFAVLGGDIVESGISTALFDLFFKNTISVFSQIPLMAVSGNHESNFISGKPELYLDEFSFPQNGPDGFKEEFYSFDVANCHILVLNSWIFSGEQSLTDEDYNRVNNWIKSDLATSTAHWQIAVTHVPVYAVHSDTTATKLKENWAPILEGYGVDLVFEGHQHVYSRSYPMYEGKINYENGVTYIMGNSGQKFYSSADETFAARTIYNTATYQLVQIDGDTLTVQTCDIDGHELDFARIPQRSITVTRGEYLETLWQAAGAPTPKGASPFTDTNSQAAAWAYERGFVCGYGGEKFGPGDIITDWQIGLIVDRMEDAA